ncbi:hypothetical protein DsansV1_C19g0162601 [Dioscorea sansibarensis]
MLISMAFLASRKERYSPLLDIEAAIDNVKLRALQLKGTPLILLLEPLL